MLFCQYVYQILGYSLVPLLDMNEQYLHFALFSYCINNKIIIVQSFSPIEGTEHLAGLLKDSCQLWDHFSKICKSLLVTKTYLLCVLKIDYSIIICKLTLILLDVSYLYYYKSVTTINYYYYYPEDPKYSCPTKICMHGFLPFRCQQGINH